MCSCSIIGYSKAIICHVMGILIILHACSMREDVYRVVKAFAEKKVALSPQAQRFVDRLVSVLHLEFCWHHAFIRGC